MTNTKATIMTVACTIAGVLEGNIEAAQRVDLLESGVLAGDVKANSFTVAATTFLICSSSACSPDGITSSPRGRPFTETPILISSSAASASSQVGHDHRWMLYG